jgi:hypothetical protein
MYDTKNMEKLKTLEARKPEPWHAFLRSPVGVKERRLDELRLHQRHAGIEHNHLRYLRRVSARCAIRAQIGLPARYSTCAEQRISASSN